MRILRASRARRYVAAFGTAVTLSVTAILATPGAAHAWAGSSPGEIYNAATWQCLDSDDAGDVYTASCDGSNYQVWQLTSNGNLQDAQTGLCLTYSFVDVYTAQCTSSLFWKQNWTYSTAGVPASIGIFGDGNEWCLDTYTSDTYSLGYVYPGTCDLSSAEDWYVFY